jgi:tRNA nucleotidyltransferase (CCA-adding enzyme)
VECKELAELVAREHGNIHQSLGFGAEAVLRLLVRCDALRRPERFLLALQACECDARGRLGKEDEAYAQGPRLALLLKAAQSVDSATVSALALQEGLKGPAVGARLDAARLAAISAALSV